MAGTRQILGHREAVDNIRKITRTMEMISTARYKAYSNRRIAIEDYHDALATAGYLLVTPQNPIDHPLLKENSSGNSAILAIGSNRGLCGSYNANIYQLVRIHINRARRLAQKLHIYAPDRKLVGMLNYHGIRPTKVYENIGEMPSGAQIDEITDEFVSQYMSGDLDYFGIVYMRFYSVSSQRTQTLTIMPLTELIDDLTTKSTVIWPWDLSFEDFAFSPPLAEMIESIAKMIIRSSIESCFMDAAFSEHVARMIAMKNATENAEEMIRELTGEYNHARQNQITRELLDIVGGVEALQ